jgi:hypothetical protein
MSNSDDNSIKIYFSDYYNVPKTSLEQYGAFDISLVTDLPLFIDPFLLFNSEKPEYQALHDEIIDYIGYLHDLSMDGDVPKGLIRQLYRFPEIRQNWLGYSLTGNAGRGLGQKFAAALDRNLHTVLSNFGDEQVTAASHLEKLTLVDDGVGKDSISDFTTNLILKYLLEYTQTFARKHLTSEQRRVFRVPHVEFNYKTHSWVEKSYELPAYEYEGKMTYVILTPEDILTKDENWINRPDLLSGFGRIPHAIPNEELRAKVNHYFNSVLPKDPSNKDKREAARKTLSQFPEVYDYYIRDRENSGEAAVAVSNIQVKDSKQLYVEKFRQLPRMLADTDFYKIPSNSYDEAYARVQFLKQVVENNDGYRIFWKKDKLLIERENDVHILYQLTWFLTPSDVNHEVNNGRGPVDFKVSRGSVDKSLVEFKVASNTKLAQNLAKQVEVYEKANKTKRSIKVIFFFTDQERLRVEGIVKDLGLQTAGNIVLIDARRDNKPSASNVK